ncbi:MAG TPA: alpha/beta fold hydrolase, partial [Candidatus Limnocylindrales bacterium]|nr:alpha/beta fold hydrolase [Candidatus Limnocylindrales bacterium]
MKLDRRRQFRWLERGTGEPVVLLHGLMSRMDHWEATLERLAPACRAIAPELPIFAPWLPEASIAELARQVRAFMDALDIPAGVVGGNSLGGHVALELALVSPQRVTGLVLAGSSGLFERTFTRGVARHPSSEVVRQKMEEVFHDPAMVTESWVRSVR